MDSYKSLKRTPTIELKSKSSEWIINRLRFLWDLRDEQTDLYLRDKSVLPAEKEEIYRMFPNEVHQA